MAAEAVIDDEPIICHIDNKPVHSIQVHIKNNHPDWTIERYRREFPDAPLLSGKAQRMIAERNEQKKRDGAAAPALGGRRKDFFHKLFDMGEVPAAMSTAGAPINVTVLEPRGENTLPYLMPVDPNYVFNIDLTKKVVLGMELNLPVYLWGYHGTGKTTILEQVAARTNRPFMRVQHTINTEESHILGQYVVRTKMVEEKDADGNVIAVKPQTVTEFQLGPLPLAMIEGMVYCADEYDFAMPSVSAVYQPVLERKPLVIKEAPAEFRVIRPHPDFRFVATGNTNGIGDETGLYQGTLIQNAANYSRYPITEEVLYMEPKVEESVLMAQAAIDKSDATKLVKFAKEVRQQFADGKISMTISPRELINAATLGIAFGGNWLTGLQLAFTNRLSRVDKKAVEEFGQRIFG